MDTWHSMSSSAMNCAQCAMRCALCRKELDPWAQEIDRSGEIPQGLIEVLQRNGYCGMRLPSEYGGGGLPVPVHCIALEEFSRLHRAFTIAANYSSGMTPMAIARHGTPEQKENICGDLRRAS
jgi:alkylation response protein AidB-like acyl-CoA dehydrogenase